MEEAQHPVSLALQIDCILRRTETVIRMVLDCQWRFLRAVGIIH